MIQLIWFLLILAEVARNYYVIEILKRTPDHRLAFGVRILVSTVLWLMAPSLAPEMRTDQWYALPVMMALTFWFLFNWLLNLIRPGKPFWYLGTVSKFDLWQREHGGAFLWFWWRLMLAMGGWSVFATGWSAVQEYPGLGANYFM